jgi:multidrug efflux pump
MSYLPWTLIFTLFASLIVAYVMNPVFAISFMKRHDEQKAIDVSFKSIRKTVFVMATMIILFFSIYLSTGNIGFKGLGNFTAFLLLIYVFNHYVLTPKIVTPFQDNLLPRFKDFYRNTIAWVITGWRPVGIIFATFGLLVFTVIMMGIVKPKVILFPSGDPDYVYVYNVMPVGTDARVTNAITKKIEEKVYEVIKKNNAEDAVNSVISNVGKNAGDPMNPDRSATPNKSKVTVAFVKKALRGNVNSDSILTKIRNEVKAMNLPGSEISVERESNGPPTGKPISIEITGDEFDVLARLEKAVLKKINQSGIEGIDQLKSDLVTNKPEIIVDIDKAKAQREGINTQQVAFAIRTALFGAEISKFRDDKDEYPIQLRLKSDDRNQIEKLLQMNVTYRDMNMGGVLRQVPLNSIANISYSTTFSQINRKNQLRMVTLGSDVVPGANANEIVQQIAPLLEEIERPSGYNIKIGGEQEDFQESAIFLAIAFISAILIIYLILATQFNSVVKPFIVFATIVLSLIGVLLGFMIFDMTFSVIMSGVGIVALAGIVVKNGILLIEFTDELRSRGYGLKEAIIEAGGTRLTPVLLTASAAVLGLIPLAFGVSIDFVSLFTHFDAKLFIGSESSVFWNILAWTIIFGLTFSTVLTLVIVPCMYYVNERVQEKFFRKKVLNTSVSEQELEEIENV